jgi:hypothetical protein
VTKRLPKGYRGIAHQTIGSDVLSLLSSVLMPEQILGKALVDDLKRIKPNDWYPIQTLLEPLELLATRLGPDSLRRVGIALFKLSHESAVREQASSAHDIVHGIDGMYHHANRGTDIGGWKVLSFEPGKAVLEKTTPHHCIMEEGILEAALRLMNVPPLIHQSACFREGADACHFVITSSVVDERWSGFPVSKKRPPSSR